MHERSARCRPSRPEPTSTPSLYDIQVTLQTPFPGTGLYKRLQAEGRLTHPGRWDRCTLFDLNYEPIGMSSDELVNGFRQLVSRLYTPEFVKQRREGYHRELRRVRSVG